MVSLKDSKGHLYNFHLKKYMFINLPRHHVIYWHKKIQYNYNDANFKNPKLSFLIFKNLDTPFWYPNCEWT